MSKVMKLSKNYSLKSQKVMKLSPIHFQLSILVIEKRRGESATPRLAKSMTPRLGESANMRIFWAIPAAFDHCFLQKIIALLLKH